MANEPETATLSFANPKSRTGLLVYLSLYFPPLWGWRVGQEDI
jgi:hypothetical protein